MASLFLFSKGPKTGENVRQLWKMHTKQGNFVDYQPGLWYDTHDNEIVWVSIHLPLISMNG